MVRANERVSLGVCMKFALRILGVLGPLVFLACQEEGGSVETEPVQEVKQTLPNGICYADTDCQPSFRDENTACLDFKCKPYNGHCISEVVQVSQYSILAPHNVQGDCKRWLCDGSPTAVTVIDKNDIPSSDECATFSCRDDGVLETTFKKPFQSHCRIGGIGGDTGSCRFQDGKYGCFAIYYPPTCPYAHSTLPEAYIEKLKFNP